MKQLYSFFMGFAFMATTMPIFGQAILLDDNHSLSGIPLNGRLILTSERDSTFWSSDGTAAGTSQFSNVKSDNEGFAILNNTIYFSGLNAANGSELWKTDGTAAGTVLVSDIWPGPDSSKPSDFIVFNNKLYFTAFTSGSGRELYEYSGSGTPAALTDLNVGPGSSFATPHYFVLNGLLYFNATNTTGNAVYALQTAGIAKILDVPAGFSVNGFINIGNTLFIAISNGSDGMRIYKTTGVAAATVVQSFSGTLSGLIPPQMINWNNKIYFTAAALGFDTELWVTDGTTTSQVADINPGANGSHPTISNSVVLNNKLVFSASTDDSGYELWVTDGTTAGTSMLKDINTADGTGSIPFLWPAWINYADLNDGTGNSEIYNRSANFNGFIFFTADNGTDGVELYKTDGTTAGTMLVKNINPAGDGAGYSYLYTKAGVVFAGNDGTNGSEPWISDGTAAGTTPIANLNLSGDSDPLFFYIWNGDIYLNATNGNGGPENYYDLYKLQGPYSPLPVTLDDFVATTSASNVLLTWNTSSENNSDKFVVMRSTDGEHFEAIGSVAAAGHSNTPENYSFLDVDAYSQGANKLYYRLNMQDKDGRAHLSKIVTATLADLPVVMSLYPNPVHHTLRIKYNAPQGGVINITELNGRVLYRAALGASTVGMHQINVSSYPSGTYILKFVQNGNTAVQKFVKE